LSAARRPYRTARVPRYRIRSSPPLPR
jgi:hypothetical protein